MPLYVTSSPNSTLYIYGKTDVGAGGTGTLSDYKPNIKFTYTCPYNPAVCPTPTNVVNSELGSDTATFTWVAATTNSSRTWVVEWGPVGFDVNTRLGRDTIYATPRYTVKNLQSGTYYEFRVQTDCGLVNGVSTWINTPFQTNCGAEAIPYSEDFDIYTTDIVSAAALTAPTTFPDNKQANCWTYTGTTSLYNTAPFSQMFLTSYATYKLGTNAQLFKCQNTSLTPTAALPQMAEDLDTLKVSFYYKNSSPTTGSRIQLGYMTDPEDGATFTNIVTLPLAEDWTKYEYDFRQSGRTYPSTVYIAFRYQANTTNTVCYAAIDSVLVDYAPACGNVANLMVADQTAGGVSLQWSPVAYCEQYRVEYGEHGFTPGTGQSQMVTAPNATISGLSATRLYDFYVTAQCTPTTRSEQSAMVTARPGCGDRQLPYTQDFDYDGYGTVAANVTATHTTTPTAYPLHDLPACWTFSGQSQSASVYPQGYIYRGTLSYGGSGNALVLRTDATTHPVYAALPTFTTRTDSCIVSFYYRNTAGTDAARLQLGYMTDPTDVSTFGPMFPPSCNWSNSA